MDNDELFILMTYQGQTRLVQRPDTFASAEARARNEFALPHNAEVKFAVDWKGRHAEIGRDAFGIVSRVEELYVTVTDAARRPARGHAVWGTPSTGPPLFSTSNPGTARFNSITREPNSRSNGHMCQEGEARAPPPYTPCRPLSSNEVHVKSLSEHHRFITPSLCCAYLHFRWFLCAS
jgi:hypothetical protein